MNPSADYLKKMLDNPLKPGIFYQSINQSINQKEKDGSE